MPLAKGRCVREATAVAPTTSDVLMCPGKLHVNVSAVTQLLLCTKTSFLRCLAMMARVSNTMNASAMEAYFARAIGGVRCLYHRGGQRARGRTFISSDGEAWRG
ncbi:hypothetical protein DQ04_04131020 [Trypanosoma grayi]|uniref:hypothetical protein n=1 Tax=Trypanosoma grayi TaxID=71804 RepID=UPI0004F47CB1|nr:hypothetical protein DQ04_04131020 [Trypanosoma grayi]KEG10134.1 hypothetical protein DQ04_04131020 [Trypanosoma grayi]